MARAEGSAHFILKLVTRKIDDPRQDSSPDLCRQAVPLPVCLVLSHRRLVGRGVCMLITVGPMKKL